jgi:hypothetical protein
MQKRRKLLWMSVTLVFAGIFAYGLGLYQVIHFNSSMEIPETGRNHVTTFKLENGQLRTAGGVKFYLDMGSRHNFITPATLRDLHALGCQLRERPTLVLTVNSDGKQQLFLRKVSLTLEMPDSLSTSGRTAIRNVEMFIADKNDDNILGMDFLERFCVECKIPSQQISLYRYAPDNYMPIARIKAHGTNLADWLGYSKHYYCTMQVNDEEPHNFYFDTGCRMQRVKMVQPTSDTLIATNRLSIGHTSGLPVQRHCRVRVGDRLKFATVAYVDDIAQHRYVVNPFRFFTQDFVIDFRHNQLMLHRTAVRTQFSEPQAKEPVATI